MPKQMVIAELPELDLPAYDITNSTDISIRIISISHRKFRNETLVEVYGLTEDGKSVVALKRGFFPYFYFAEPVGHIAPIFAKDSAVLEMSHRTLQINREDKSCTKVVVKHPEMVQEYKRRYSFQALMADIPFKMQFVYDNDLSGCVKVTGNIIERSEYSSDIVIVGEYFKECEAFRPKMKILSFDIENSIKDGHLYCICIAIRELDGRMTFERIYYDSEELLVKKFEETVRKHRPDIITGYNIDRYDVPHTMSRVRLLMGDNATLKIGKSGDALRPLSDFAWKADGIVFIDAWWHVKKEKTPKRETLNFVANLLFKESKLDVDPKKMDVLWYTERERCLDYCQKDAELALRILEEIKVIEKYMDIATVARIPFEDALHSSASILIDAVMIRQADRKNIGIPETRPKRESDDTEQIEGGYVHQTKPGLYKWVCVLDFKSMYPSIIIENNICFTTLKEGEITEDGIQIFDKTKKGILPEMLKGLLAQRTALKAEMKTTTDEKRKKYLNSLQDAVKVIMNSFYGVFCSSFFRLTDSRIGAAVTGWGRRSTKHIINTLTNEGITVVGGDTDSTFIASPHSDIEETKKFGEELCKRFSHGAMQIEFEKVFSSMYTHGKKKRYFGNIIWPKADLLIRGYETRRSDSFEFMTDCLMESFKLILDDKHKECKAKSIMWVKQLLDGEIPPEKLVVAKSTKSESEYKNPEIMPAVLVARQMRERGIFIPSNWRVSWIVTDASTTPQTVKAYYDGEKFEEKPDYQYYAKRLAHTLSNLLEFYEVTEDELLSGKKQSRLDLFV
jgi:DNA polymerase I